MAGFSPFSDSMSAYLAKHIVQSIPNLVAYERYIGTAIQNFKIGSSGATIQVPSSSPRNRTLPSTTPPSITPQIPSSSASRGGDKHRCEHVMTRGKYRGQECGKLAKFEHNGKWYCGSLKSGENGNDEYTGHIRFAQLSSLNAQSNGAQKATKQKEDDCNLKARELLQKSMDHSQVSVREHPQFAGIFYHPVTNMAVNPENNTVIGNLEEDGSIGPLSERQKAICSTNNWEYKPEKEEETEENEEEETDESKRLEEAETETELGSSEDDEQFVV